MVALLAALKFVPAMFSAGLNIYEAVTGETPPEEAKQSPEALAEHVAGLPPEQQAEITKRVLDLKAEMQKFDTERFTSMNEGDAEKIRATARPEIALRAMGVIETFAKVFKWLGLATLAEWIVRLACEGFGWPAPTVSLWQMIAQAAPVAEVIWAPLLASFWVSAEVIKKYMGCRERDKARADEMKAGKPLESTAATIEAAGGGIANIVRAWRGAR